jgi:hypothetical protein
MTGNRLASLGLIAMPRDKGFYFVLEFPSGTSHTGRTIELSIESKASGKVFELTGPNTEITVASEVITFAVPSSTTGGIVLSSIETDECEFGIDVLESSGVLAARFQGNVKWPTKRGMFNES